MRRTLPSTVALMCFETAARLESFTRAAAALNLTQSAVSRQIRLLEALVEQPLFDRVRQRVFLTDAGRRYLGEVQPGLESLEAATLRLRSFRALSGALNIGTYPTLGSRWLLRHLLAFAAAMPELRTNTITYLDNSGFDAEVIDIGIVQGDAPWPGLRADPLMPEDLAVVAAPVLVPRPFEDARDLLALRPLQHVTRPHSWAIWFADQGAAHEEHSGGLVFPQFEMVIEAVLAGHGVAVMPLVLVREELASGRLVLAHRHVARTASAYYLVTPEAKTMLPRIESFRSWLLEATAGERSTPA